MTTTAAKENCASVPPAVLLQTRVRGLAPKNTTAIGADLSVTSTSRWASWHVYDGTASARLVGLDYFGARYFSGAQGRFTSPDEFQGGIVDPFTGQQVGQPGPLPYADITDPQTINKYAYVRNNPLRYTDPDGHVIDTLADIGFIAYDIYQIAKGGATTTNVLALGADVVGAVVPFATGLGAAVRAEHAIEAGVHIAEAGIKANRAKGVAAEAKAAGELVSEGKKILGSQVSVQTSQGRRVVDHLTQTAEGKIAGVEVKSGKATRNATQRAKDAEIANQGGKIVGKNAPENLRGRKVKFPTEERHYPD